MKRIENSIILIGKTCSGKSTLANQLCKTIPFKKASFGGYLFNYAQENQLDTRKDNLQVIGHNFITADYKSFLQDVLDFSNPGINVVFEGVRHLVIHDEIKSISSKTISFFIDTAFDVRFDRFNLREFQKITKEEFLDLDNHPVESEIELLGKSCDVVLDGCENVETLLQQIIQKQI